MVHKPYAPLGMKQLGEGDFSGTNEVNKIFCLGVTRSLSLKTNSKMLFIYMNEMMKAKYIINMTALNH